MSRKAATVTHGMLDDGYWTCFTSNFDDYQLGAPIGFGASSVVYAATFTPPSSSASSSATQIQPEGSSGKSRGRPRPTLHIDTASAASASAGHARACAIKISGLHSDVDQLFRETKVLGLSRHPNVLRILAAFTLPPDHRRVAIVTPLAGGGSLAGILKWRASTYRQPASSHGLLSRKSVTADAEVVQGTLDEEEIRGVVKQVLDGLVYLHSNGYLHRDLKAGNLLLDHDGTVLLADFGVAGDINEPAALGVTAIPAAEDVRFDRRADPTRPDSTRRPSVVGDIGKRKSFVGTPSWMAPEVILGQRYDAKADIWSLGMTILELAHGQVPYAQSSARDVLVKIVSDPPPSLSKSSAFSKSMSEFTEACLQKDPSRRPSASELTEHHWLKGAKGPQFLARALLADILPLEQRQELRRVPTVASLTSLTSSWDFNSPSLPASPAKSTFSRTVLRSPSIISQLQEYFPLAQSASHSRTASIYSALPPSPSVPLRQWAERSASVAAPSVMLPETRRTGSERGRKRVEGETAGQSLRRGHSASFDMHLPRPTPRNRQYADISPKTSLARLGRQEVDAGDVMATVPGPMSPVMEATPSAQSAPRAAPATTPGTPDEKAPEMLSESPTALQPPAELPDEQRPSGHEPGVSGRPVDLDHGRIPEAVSEEKQQDGQERPAEWQAAAPENSGTDQEKHASLKKKGWMRQPSVRKAPNEKGKERLNGHHGLISTLSHLGLRRRS